MFNQLHVLACTEFQACASVFASACKRLQADALGKNLQDYASSATGIAVNIYVPEPISMDVPFCSRLTPCIPAANSRATPPSVTCVPDLAGMTTVAVVFAGTVTVRWKRLPSIC